MLIDFYATINHKLSDKVFNYVKKSVLVIIILLFVLYANYKFLGFYKGHNVEKMKFPAASSRVIRGSDPIEIDNAYALFKQGKALFIDARDHSFFRYSHIPHSISYPYQERENWVNIFSKKVERDSLIITYCDSKICGLSRALSDYLLSWGYNNIYYLAGGIDQWRTKGYPIVSNK